MRQGGQICGLVSLTTILCSLSLCVFALLTLATADRERRFAELNALRTAEYYAAECAAAERVSALDAASIPEGGTVTASEPVGETMTLMVELTKRNGRLKVTRWQTVYTGNWTPEDSIAVWDGTV